jgi:hypothetical protein
MIQIKLPTLCFLLLFQAEPIYALQTATLVEACKNKNDKNFNFCMGYIGGMYEGVRLQFDYTNTMRLALGQSEDPHIWCAPHDSSYEIMAGEFLKFTADNPQYARNEIYAEIAVYSFFSDRFNCS